MRAGLAFAIAVVFASPAHAACRLHSIWNYPWKQRCPVVAQVEDVRPTPPEKPRELPRFTVNNSDTIILSPQPGRTDEEGRAQAIEILKEVMGQ